MFPGALIKWLSCLLSVHLLTIGQGCRIPFMFLCYDEGGQDVGAMPYRPSAPER